MQIRLEDPAAQLGFGERLAPLLLPPCVLYLEGDLGTGKTTLARGILRGLGHRGKARSPTYTLLEPYELAAVHLYHLDLYRLADPEELEYLGLRDLLSEDALWLVEWPDRGLGALPDPDLRIQLDYAPRGRCLRLVAGTGRGERIIQGLAAVHDQGL